MAICERCGQRNAATSATKCLACLAATAAPANQNQDDGELESALAFAGMDCEACGAPCRPVNLFGGGGHYQCENPLCGRVSASAVEGRRWTEARGGQS